MIKQKTAEVYIKFAFKFAIYREQLNAHVKLECTTVCQIWHFNNFIYEMIYMYMQYRQ